MRSAVTPIGSADKWLPSLAARDGARWAAGEDALQYPEEQIIRSAKRAITRRAESFIVFDGEREVELSADEVIVEILRKVVTVAEHEYVGLSDAVEVRLGCPAMWEGDQRRRLVRLAKEAGISVEENSVVDEPIAAGVAWVNRQLARNIAVRGKLLVFDMGGGTLDVAVLTVDASPGDDELETSVSVQSAVGVDSAGDSLDEAIERDFEDKLAKLGFDVASHAKRIELKGWIQRAAREAKIDLSTAHDTHVVFNHPSINIPAFDYTRLELETAFTGQLDGAVETVFWALRSALMAQVKSHSQRTSMRPSQARKLSKEDLANGVQFVVLAGGMAHIPMVRERMATIFGADRVWVGVDETSTLSGTDSTEMIALGLAHHGTYDRMNLHRPGFDFVLEWHSPDTSERQEQVVYEAYSPLYSFTDVIQTDQTKYNWSPSAGALPRKGEGLLKVRSVAGNFLGFRYRGQEIEGLRFRFGDGTPTVTLEPNGRVFWRDGAGYQESVRVARWPVIRGFGQESLVIEEVSEAVETRWTLKNLPWHMKPYD